MTVIKDIEFSSNMSIIHYSSFEENNLLYSQ